MRRLLQIIVCFCTCIATVYAGAIHDAAKTGDAKKMGALLEDKRQLIHEREDETARTALHYAAENGNKEILQMLLARKADPNVGDKFGWSSLHIAAYNGNKEAMELMLGVPGLNLEAKESEGKTPLHLAAMQLKSEVVVLLVARKADINAGDNNGWTPLHYAVFAANKEMIEWLLAHGADINARDRLRRTPLHTAMEGATDIAELLLERGIDINARDRDRETPLGRAKRKKNAPMVELLMQRGAKE